MSLALVTAPAVHAEPSAPVTPQVTRAEMLQRAAGWLTADNGAQVPYSMEQFWVDGYRQDCSGYVSMAAKLGNVYPRGGPDTVALVSPRYTVPVPVAELKPGDLFIDAVDEPGPADFRHVVIFERWTTTDRTEYLAYEQRGGHGTDHRVLRYGLEPDSKYHAVRLRNIVD
ncbi:hypothetical protein ADL03_27760 [Nocardia sp. NRRL S-836]|nr:hypothetical protein ADL03_27760 [Nocardia sp. NRRL S-836]